MTQASLFEDKDDATIVFETASGQNVRFDGRTGEVDGAIQLDELKAFTLVARDLLQNEGANFKYIAMSGLQKQIRRGDVRAAVAWQRLLVSIQGASKTKQYLKNILLEETRNLDLVQKWTSVKGLTPEAMCVDITRSRKRWEPASGHNLYPTYMHARKSVEKQAPPGVSALEKMLESRDPHTIFAALWLARADGGLVAAFWDAGMAELYRRGFPYLEALASRRTDVFYATSTLAEALAGLWDLGFNDLLPDRTTAEVQTIPAGKYVPAMHSYLYDKHTRPGKRAIVENLRDHHPNLPQPKKLDLRWAGMGRGVVWRYAAWPVHGVAMKDATWESVPIDAQTWQHAVDLDIYFNPALHKQAGVFDSNSRSEAPF